MKVDKGRARVFRTGRYVFVVVLAIAATALASCGSLKLPADQQATLEAQAAAQCLERRGSEDLVPQKAFRTDGCSLWPDGEWQSCCIEHDMTYWCGGPTEARAVADRALRACVDTSGHAVHGALMQLGTRLGGSHLLPTSYRWGYGWPWLADQASSDDEER